MATITEKIKAKEELPEVRKKPTNPARLHMSYDDAVAENRREKEKEARLKLAAEEIEKELEQEEVEVKKKKASKKVKVSDLEGASEQEEI